MNILLCPSRGLLSIQDGYTAHESLKNISSTVVECEETTIVPLEERLSIFKNDLSKMLVRIGVSRGRQFFKLLHAQDNHTIIGSEHDLQKLKCTNKHLDRQNEIICSHEYVRDGSIDLFPEWLDGQGVGELENACIQIIHGTSFYELPRYQKRYFVEDDTGISSRAWDKLLKQQKYPPRHNTLSKKTMKTIPQDSWSIANRDWEYLSRFPPSEAGEDYLDIEGAITYNERERAKKSFFKTRRLRRYVNFTSNLYELRNAISNLLNPPPIVTHICNKRGEGKWKIKNECRRRLHVYKHDTNTFVSSKGIRAPFGMRRMESSSNRSNLIDRSRSIWAKPIVQLDLQTKLKLDHFNEWREKVWLVGIEENPGPRNKNKNNKTKNKNNERALVVYRPPPVRQTMRPPPPQPARMNPSQESSWSAPDVGTGIGSTIGNFVAPGIGGVIGGLLGRGAGLLFKAVTGHGAYAIRSNSLLTAGNKIVAFGDGSIRIRYREFVSFVSSTINFQNLPFNINPGNEGLFPYLALHAQGYEQYRFDGLIFEYISTSANALNSTNTALGQVIMATDYNASNAPFVSEQQMLATTFSVFGAPSVDLLHPVECDITTMQNPWLNVRTGNIPSSGTIGLYDYGIFQFGTLGSQAAAVVGTLFVTYDCVFQKPVLPDNGGGLLLADHYSLISPAVGGSYFGTSRVLNSGSNLGTVVTGANINFPTQIQAGHYMVVYGVTGSGTAMASITITPTNCSLVSSWNNAAATVLSTSTSTGTSAIYCFVVSITAFSASIGFSVGVIPTPASFGDLFVMALPGALTLASVDDIYDTFRSMMDRYEHEKAIMPVGGPSSNSIVDNNSYCRSWWDAISTEQQSCLSLIEDEDKFLLHLHKMYLDIRNE